MIGKLKLLLDSPQPHKQIAYRAKMGVVVKLPRKLRRRVFAGTKRYCPICDHSLRGFWEYRGQPDIWCPICRSHPRHRFVWSFFEKHTNLFEDISKRMLHVAPEPAIEPRLRETQNLQYITSDFDASKAMVQMDITNIEYPDNHFDIIYCSHVLEHVLDDLKAMREFHRVLKHGGWSVIMVPLSTTTTYEDASITSPEARRKAFGQHDHVRIYGPDIKERLETAGFKVTGVQPADILDQSDVVRMNISDRERLFLCEKTENA